MKCFFSLKSKSLKDHKRVGRGIGSGMGKTSTVGHKGQRARSGRYGLDIFPNGSQTSVFRLAPKRGFKPLFCNSKSVLQLGIDRLVYLLSIDLIDKSSVTVKSFSDLGLLANGFSSIKLIDSKSCPSIPYKLNISDKILLTSGLKNKIISSGGSFFVE